jgi:hypothetical protein
MTVSLRCVAYVTAEARQELLRDVAQAIGHLGRAIAALGSAYEALDEHAADTLEAELFRPVQVAYGRAQRTYASFAQRYSLSSRSFAPVAPGTASRPAAELLEAAVVAVAEADQTIAELQDSMRPVEVGDPELRAGLAEVRVLLAEVPLRARRAQSLLGR